jgi:hypothetical protein
VILVDAMIMFLRDKGVRFLKLTVTADYTKHCYVELCRVLTVDKIRNNLRDFTVKDAVAEYPLKDDGAALKEWEEVLDDLCLKHGAPKAERIPAVVTLCVKTKTTKPVVVPTTKKPDVVPTTTKDHKALSLAKSSDYITERLHKANSPPFMVSSSSSRAGRSSSNTPSTSLEHLMLSTLRHAGRSTHDTMEHLMLPKIRHAAVLPPSILKSHEATSFTRNLLARAVVKRDNFAFNNNSHSMSSGLVFKNQREADVALSVVMALRRNEALAKNRQEEQDIRASMAIDSWLGRR